MVVHNLFKIMNILDLRACVEGNKLIMPMFQYHNCGLYIDAPNIKQIEINTNNQLEITFTKINIDELKKVNFSDSSNKIYNNCDLLSDNVFILAQQKCGDSNINCFKKEDSLIKQIESIIPKIKIIIKPLFNIDQLYVPQNVIQFRYEIINKKNQMKCVQNFDENKTYFVKCGLMLYLNRNALNCDTCLILHCIEKIY
jgi:hypothetical protein